MLGAMKTVPQFRCDPKIITADQARIDCRLQPLARFDLVAVVAGAIKMAIATLNRRLNGISGDLVLDFPETESNRRDLAATGELDRFAGNVCSFHSLEHFQF
jgi:hypothetical protein